MAKREYFQLSDLSGGINPNRPPMDIALNQAAESMNLRLTDLGNLQSRSGIQDLGVTLPANCQGLGAWRDEQTVLFSQILVASDGKIFRIDLSTQSLVEIYSGLDPSAPVSFTPLPKLTLISNGSDAPLQYDGVQVTSLGVEAPTSAPTETANSATGNLDGEYSYVYTYFTSGGRESTQSPSITVTTSLEVVQLSATPSSDPKVTSIIWYRRNPGSAVFLRVGTGPNTSAPLQDFGNALQPITVPVASGMPSSEIKVFASFAGYTFGATDTEVYWSQPLNPDAWNPLDVTAPPFASADKIQTIFAYEDNLIILGRRNIVVLAGQGGDWVLRRLDTEVGVVSPRAWALVPGGFVFLSSQGLFSFPSNGELAPQISIELLSMSEAERLTAVMAYVPEERGIWLATSQRFYNISLINQAVFPYDLRVGYVLQGGRTGAQLPVMVSSTKLYQYGSATDDGDPIDVKWVSKIMREIGAIELTKSFRRVMVWATRKPNQELKIRFRSDNFFYEATLNPPASTGTTFWNQFNWNQANWAAPLKLSNVTQLPPNVSQNRSVQVEVLASADRDFLLSPPITLEFRSSNRFLDAAF